jgi:hypothetical protein
MKNALIGCLTIIIGMAITWAITVGVVWLICLCFSLKFSLLTGTGVWLALTLLKFFLNKD